MPAFDGSAASTGWLNLPTNPGFSLSASRYQVTYGHATLTLSLDGAGTWGSGYVFHTLPAAARPTAQVIGLGQYGTATRPFFVNTDGTVTSNGAFATGIYGTLTWPLG